MQGLYRMGATMLLHHRIQNSRHSHSEKHIDHVKRLCVHCCDDDAETGKEEDMEVRRWIAPFVHDCEPFLR